MGALGALHADYQIVQELLAAKRDLVLLLRALRRLDAFEASITAAYRSSTNSHPPDDSR